MKKKQLYLVSSVAALAGLLFGFDTGVISGAILFINKEFHLNHVQTELVVSAVLFGAFFSAMCSGRLCDRFGRKKTLITTALIFILGTLLSAFAINSYYLILGRVILGIAIGIASFTAPLYLAEISPPQSRGFIVTLNQLAITLGILFSYLVDYYYTAAEAWRMMLFVGIIPALLLLLGMLLLPESPRFLILIGKLNDARKVFAKLRPRHLIDNEINAIVDRQNQQTLKGRDLFADNRLSAILLVGVSLAIAQQVTGINTIIYYAPTIFEMAGFHTSHAIFVTIFVGLINVVFTLMALPLIDKIGRKKLLLLGVSGMCVSLLCLGLAFVKQDLSDTERLMTLISMMTYIACFAFSLGPMVFVILSEIFPLSIRGQAMSLAMCANWGANLLVAMTFLSLINTLGTANTFYLFASLCLATLAFIFLFIPETKGVSLEQIEKNIFDGAKSKHLGRGDIHVTEG